MRLRALCWLLAASLLGAALVRLPLLAVPSYESGLLVGALAAIASAHLAAARARRRPPKAVLRWGALAQAPGEQVAAETRATLLAGLALVAIPLALLATVSLTLECRTAAGVGVFLMVSAPAVLAGAALGTLAGSVSRSAWRETAFVVAAAALSAAAAAGELLVGPRHVLHDWILGPLSASAFTGYDASLALPASAWLHRGFSLVLSALLLACAALVRSYRDAPEPTGPEPTASGDGWEASRADDATRTRFLLAHARRGALRAVAGLALAAAPFLAFSDRCGITPGRWRLEAELSAVVETAHARLHFDPRSPAFAKARQAAVQVEFARWQVTRWLGLDPPWKVDVWIHRDDDSMFELTGARGYLFAAPWNHELHVLASDTGNPRALRHELVHVLAADLGAPPFRVSVDSGLTEGLATALDEGFARLPEAHEGIAAAALAGQVPGARELMSPLGFFAGGMDRAYRASASFVGWLLLERGPRPFGRAYAWGSWERAYGTSLDELGRQWKDFLARDVHPSPAVAARARERYDPARRPPLRLVPCARLGREAGEGPAERAALLSAAGMHDEAADLYCEAWSLTSDPLQLQSALAESIAAGRLEAALSLAGRALASPLLPDTRRDAILRKRVRLLGALGRWDEAQGALAAWRDAGLAAWPEEEGLEAEALARRDELAERYFRAAFAGDEDARVQLRGVLAEAPAFAPALHELLLREESGRQDAPALASGLPERFALASPGTPQLAAWHLLAAAAAAEEAGCADLAEREFQEAGALAGILPLQRLAAEDGVERVRFSRDLRVTGLPAQQTKASCRR